MQIKIKEMKTCAAEIGKEVTALLGKKLSIIRENEGKYRSRNILEVYFTPIVKLKNEDIHARIAFVKLSCRQIIACMTNQSS